MTRQAKLVDPRFEKVRTDPANYFNIHIICWANPQQGTAAIAGDQFSNCCHIMAAQTGTATCFDNKNLFAVLKILDQLTPCKPQTHDLLP